MAKEELLIYEDDISSMLVSTHRLTSLGQDVFSPSAVCAATKRRHGIFGSWDVLVVGVNYCDDADIGQKRRLAANMAKDLRGGIFSMNIDMLKNVIEQLDLEFVTLRIKLNEETADKMVLELNNAFTKAYEYFLEGVAERDVAMRSMKRL